jgi:3D (Asp-Asp-Asp) domain-containing protein
MLTNIILTAYCWCAVCNGEAGQPTASGAKPRTGVTIAAPRHVPFGTRVHIPGIGWRTVQDRTAFRYNGRWDIYVASHREAKKFGKRRVTIKL